MSGRVIVPAMRTDNGKASWARCLEDPHYLWHIFVVSVLFGLDEDQVEVPACLRRSPRGFVCGDYWFQVGGHSAENVIEAHRHSPFAAVQAADLTLACPVRFLQLDEEPVVAVDLIGGGPQ